MIIKRNGQCAMECNARVAIDCVQNSSFCDSEEEAQDLVKDECWISMDNGWICVNCNAYYMKDQKINRENRGFDGAE